MKHHHLFAAGNPTVNQQGVEINAGRLFESIGQMKEGKVVSKDLVEE
jgi:hypothetical protein